MQNIKNFFRALTNWIFVGKRLPIIIAAFIVIATTVTISVVATLNKPESNIATAYVTVKGLGEGKDFENRQIKFEDGDTVKEIFSLKYPDIYESFGRPLIQYNEFYSLLGVRKTQTKSFHVTIDTLHDNNLDQAYVYGGQTVVIEYY